MLCIVLRAEKSCLVCLAICSRRTAFSLINVSKRSYSSAVILYSDKVKSKNTKRVKEAFHDIKIMQYNNINDMYYLKC